MTVVKKFTKEWYHFLKCLNLKESCLDARAIKFMNEAGNYISEIEKEAREGKHGNERIRGRNPKRA